MTSPARKLITTLALLIAAPLAAAPADGLRILVESAELVPILQPEELTQQLSAIESEYSAYTGFTVISLRDQASSLNPADSTAVDAFRRELDAAIQSFDGNEYTPYNSPQNYAELVAELEALRGSGSGPVESSLLDEIQRIEDTYVSISGFGLINLVTTGRSLVGATTGGDGGSGKGGGRRSDGGAGDTSGFWADFDAALENYYDQAQQATQQPEAPYADLTERLRQVRSDFFATSGGNDQLSVRLVIENHDQQPITISDRARIRILTDAPRDLVLDTSAGAIALQGFESRTIAFVSGPLSEFGSRAAADIRIGVHDGVAAVIAIRDSGGQTYTARTRLGSGDAEATDDALKDALDAADG
jgi:hypothetical protein